jgi:hypothetical protein
MAILVAHQPRTVFVGPSGTNYVSDQQRRITATDAGDIAFLQREGCVLSLTDGEASTVSIALAAGAANVMTDDGDGAGSVGNDDDRRARARALV